LYIDVIVAGTDCYSQLWNEGSHSDRTTDDGR